MAEIISLNGKVLSNYQRMYPNLQGFSYDSSDDSLVFLGEKISLSGNGLSRIDPIFFEMAPEDIFTFLKYGFYINSQDSMQVSNLFEQFIITEEEITYLENFARKFNQRCQIYAKNKDMLDKLSTSNENAKAFCKELIDSHRVIYQAQTQANANGISMNAATILYQAYENDLNSLANNQTNSNNNAKDMTLENSISLTRTKPGQKMNYNDFEAMERDYIESKKRLGIAGFSSIILLIAITTAIGIYLGITIMS